MELVVGLLGDGGGMIVEVFDFRTVDRNRKVALIHANKKSDSLKSAGIFRQPFWVEE